MSNARKDKIAKNASQKSPAAAVSTARVSSAAPLRKRPWLLAAAAALLLGWLGFLAYLAIFR